MNTYLNINNLVKKFGSFTALSDISLQINQGEFICFLGPSGCGKTTLLRAIAGLDLATSGCILQDGKDTTFLPPEKRDFGIVFQSYALFPNLTVAENISVGLHNQGKSVAEAVDIVNHWLGIIGLESSAPKYPNQLSGGQQQRVALARALALSPGLLLLDEPLSALDAQVRTHLREEIRSLQRKLGITTIMVTHDQEEALAMADRIVVMNHGVIEQVGTPQEIYDKPASRFVAEFVGNMNFIASSVISDDQIRIAETLLPKPKRELTRGDMFDLAVRPEDIEFSNDSQAIPVQIKSMEFQGTYVRTECQLVGNMNGSMIKVDVPIRDVRKLELANGEFRRISYSDDFSHTFPRKNNKKSTQAVGI
ncbi:putative 2-aminoethylphosphonate ABC transporter ATP-binding protein [Moritella marina ATCC 15381]|uniref:Putative 2-aminoethylphosphonate ABC transporter ATP-binding protein n=1 Tax=Moritella marina ATCC 15381 TaxID=1202962 RepID=A0A5J6WMP2_MORMI|nr:putative 2-aminoethylphosphonate ABC transporter ATP-binding protein [Moritella marina]QFI39237.1 putative 2-aminoethylphosphonate ABC transporter ATP-binding protein [Moritella marina ATCC 15381]